VVIFSAHIAGGEDKISGTCQIIGKISKTKRATFSNWKERLLNV